MANQYLDLKYDTFPSAGSQMQKAMTAVDDYEERERKRKASGMLAGIKGVPTPEELNKIAALDPPLAQTLAAGHYYLSGGARSQSSTAADKAAIKKILNTQSKSLQKEYGIPALNNIMNTIIGDITVPDEDDWRNKFGSFSEIDIPTPEGGFKDTFTARKWLRENKNILGYKDDKTGFNNLIKSVIAGVDEAMLQGASEIHYNRSAVTTASSKAPTAPNGATGSESKKKDELPTVSSKDLFAPLEGASPAERLTPDEEEAYISKLITKLNVINERTAGNHKAFLKEVNELSEKLIKQIKTKWVNDPDTAQEYKDKLIRILNGYFRERT